MRLNFLRTFKFTMEREGTKFHKVAGDRGGATSKGGITLATARRLNLDLDNDGDVDEADLLLVDEGILIKAFRDIAWDAVNADSLPGGIDLIAADIAWNSFPGKFKQFLREGYASTIETLTARRKSFYTYQGKIPGQEKFLKGWLNRADLAYAEAKLCDH